jgi:hypothetical protein
MTRTALTGLESPINTGARAIGTGSRIRLAFAGVSG